MFLIRDDGLVPAADWDLRTRNGRPTAYRVTISEVGGGRTETALAPEVLHFCVGGDVAAPWTGVAPLKRAQLTAGMLEAVETALSEVFEMAPLGSQVVPFPETPEVDREALGRSFRGNRGRVLVRESVAVTSAGGPAPNTDWKPSSISPDLEKAMAIETLGAARDSIAMVYGVLPAMLNASTTGPMVREGQRHLAQWCLQPIAAAMAEECREKLATTVSIDVMRPLQAFDAGGRARAASAIVQTLAMAREAGVDSEHALNLVDWKE